MPKKIASKKRERDPAGTGQGLIDATVRLMLKQGFAGTSVNLNCKEAGMTKGSFFHHFERKEAFGMSAVEWWGQMGTALYAVAWHNSVVDPLGQLHQMIGFTMRKDESRKCMMSQELASTNPIIQAACAKELHSWTDSGAKMLSAAKNKHKPVTEFELKALAWFLKSLWQGSILVGKPCESQQMIRHNLKLARCHVNGLFGIHISN